MKRRGFLLTGVLTMAHLVGCGSREHSVGAEGQSINMSRCSGANTQCDAFESQELAVGELIECTPASTSEIQREFVVDLASELCSECQFSQISVEKLAAGRDETVWVIGRIHRQWHAALESEEALFVRHYGSGGALLGATEMAIGSSHLEVDIASGKDNNAYLATYWSHATPNADAPLNEETLLYEYDASATELRPPLAFDNVARTLVRSGENGDVVIAGNARDARPIGALGKLDPFGALLWVQSNVRTTGVRPIGVSGLALNTAGEPSVLAERNPNYGDPTTSFGLSHFDTNGNFVWDRTLNIPFISGYPAVLLADAEGNMTIAGQMAELAGAPPFPPHIVAARISKDGELQWARALRNLDLAVVPATGDLLVAGFEDGLSLSPDVAWVIDAISADGTSCHRYVADNADGHLIIGAQVVSGTQQDAYVASNGMVMRYSGLVH